MKMLIVVDMQNDFIDGALGTPEAAAIVEKVTRRIEESSGELIIFTKDTHQDDYLTTPEGKKLPVPHCVEGTHGWQLNDKIFAAWKNNKNTIKAENLTDNAITKPVFGSVDLVEFVKSRQNDITEIEMLGLCTDICVVSNSIMIKNALPAMPISVNASCCAGVTPKTHDEALSVMQMCQIDVM